MWTRDALAKHIEGGATVSFLLFWGHTPKRAGHVDASCLSQWFPRRFSADGVSYATGEHFMMAGKARLFRDERALTMILAAKTPAEAKKLGRSVRGYDDEAWERVRLDVVVRGNVAKFGDHTDLREFFDSTGDKVLVEASPRDAVWGIGLGASNPAARDPSKWRGRNLLGFALMEARTRLRQP